MKHALALALVMAFSAPALAGSDTPPKGPTWERSLLAAHAKAVKQGLPIFLYFTKTY